MSRWRRCLGLPEAERESSGPHDAYRVRRRTFVGLRLDGGEPDWREVEDVLTESYVLVAPKTLARRLSV